MSCPLVYNFRLHFRVLLLVGLLGTASSCTSGITSGITLKWKGYSYAFPLGNKLSAEDRSFKSIPGVFCLFDSVMATRKLIQNNCWTRPYLISLLSYTLESYNFASANIICLYPPPNLKLNASVEALKSFSYQFRIQKFRLEMIKYLQESVLFDYLF